MFVQGGWECSFKEDGSVRSRNTEVIKEYRNAQGTHKHSRKRASHQQGKEEEYLTVLRKRSKKEFVCRSATGDSSIL